MEVSCWDHHLWTVFLKAKHVWLPIFMKRFNAFHEGFIAPAIFIHLTSHWPATLCLSRCDWLDIQQRVNQRGKSFMNPLVWQKSCSQHLSLPWSPMAATSNQSLVQKHGRAQFFVVFFHVSEVSNVLRWEQLSEHLGFTRARCVKASGSTLPIFPPWTLHSAAWGFEDWPGKLPEMGVCTRKIIGTFRKVW